MNPSFVVRIVVDCGKAGEEVGSGYVVAANLILTAYHTIAPDDRADTDTPIKIEWAERYEPTQLGIAAIKAQWAEYDIAFLECPFPEDTIFARYALPIIATDQPYGNDWTLAGYPMIQGHQSLGLSAKGLFTFDNENKFTVKLGLPVIPDKSSIPAKDKKTSLWGGMSGAAIFALETNVLHGVVNFHNTWTANSLEGISLAWLRKECPTFDHFIKENISQPAQAKHHSTILERLKIELQRLFDQQASLYEFLNKSLKAEIPINSSKALSAYLVDKLPIDEAFTAIYHLCLSEEKKYSDKTSLHWLAFSDTIQQCCGWLLLKTVRPNWWNESGLDIDFGVKQRLYTDFPLRSIERSYVEIIISYCFEKPAEFGLDKRLQPVPKVDELDIYLFDAISVGASDWQVLGSLYYDLVGLHTRCVEHDKITETIDDLVELISAEVHSKVKSRDYKPIYYLVTHEYYQLLQSFPWFKQFNSLTGQLYFVQCSNPQGSSHSSPCEGKPLTVLTDLAKILRICKPHPKA